jgi:hypothetical protein
MVLRYVELLREKEIAKSMPSRGNFETLSSLALQNQMNVMIYTS